jgi:hypothetical protein
MVRRSFFVAQACISAGPGSVRFSLHCSVTVVVCVVVAHAGKSPCAVEQNTTISGLDSAVGLMGGFEATMYDDSHVSSD